MTDRRFTLFLFVFVTVLAGSPVLLWALGLFSLRLYFMISFLWLLITSEVFAPRDSGATWWRRLQLIKIAGWIGLAYLVVERIIIVTVL